MALAQQDISYCLSFVKFIFCKLPNLSFVAIKACCEAGWACASTWLNRRYYSYVTASSYFLSTQKNVCVCIREFPVIMSPWSGVPALPGIVIPRASCLCERAWTRPSPAMILSKNPNCPHRFFFFLPWINDGKFWSGTGTVCAIEIWSCSNTNSWHSSEPETRWICFMQKIFIKLNCLCKLR